MKRVLLHICCGICASYPFDRLKSEGYQVVGYFYNPNIDNEAEYYKRLQVATSIANILKFELIIGPYNAQDWRKHIKGLEQEKEGGKRCDACFKMRLERTFHKTLELHFDHFASTLSVSPHKDAKRINEIGASISTQFLGNDFKKDNGFKKTSNFASYHKLYRQDYCGCSYSKRQ